MSCLLLVAAFRPFVVLVVWSVSVLPAVFCSLRFIAVSHCVRGHAGCACPQAPWSWVFRFAIALCFEMVRDVFFAGLKC